MNGRSPFNSSLTSTPRNHGPHEKDNSADIETKRTEPNLTSPTQLHHPNPTDFYWGPKVQKTKKKMGRKMPGTGAEPLPTGAPDSKGTIELQHERKPQGWNNSGHIEPEHTSVQSDDFERQ